jgi:hypothetical protein
MGKKRHRDNFHAQKYKKLKRLEKREETIRQLYHEKHREEFEKYSAYTNQELRAMSFDLLGQICVHCGVEDIRVLHIDHVFADGSKERREIGTRGIYIKLLESNGYGYQILCMNCGAIKRIVNNEDRPEE